MGATGWSYFVPYEADIPAALQRLREDVFRRGDFQYGDPVVTEEQRKAFLEHMPPDWLQKVRKQAESLEEPMKAAYLQQAERMRDTLVGGTPAPRKRKPKTIERLLELQGESGTHSILDINSISPKPESGTVSPLPKTKLIELLGSEQPTHDQIERASSAGALEEFTSERWQGIYVVAYDDGSPSEIFFAGCSGD